MSTSRHSLPIINLALELVTLLSTKRIGSSMKMLELEGQQLCMVAFLDIAQAFDKVWHTGLLYKLNTTLPGPYYLPLKTYLHSRYFQQLILHLSWGTMWCPAGKCPRTLALLDLYRRLAHYRSHHHRYLCRWHQAACSPQWSNCRLAKTPTQS